jgi:hypothetical protein
VAKEAHIQINLRSVELVSIFLPRGDEGGQVTKEGHKIWKLRICGKVSDFRLDGNNLMEKWLFELGYAEAIMQGKDDARLGSLE